MNKTEKAIEKILTTDGRTKLFKEKLRKLGYAKKFYSLEEGVNDYINILKTHDIFS